MLIVALEKSRGMPMSDYDMRGLSLMLCLSG